MAPGYNELKNMNQSVLCRYITRPAIANERLKRNRAGQVVLQLKSPYKDGTTHIVMEPLEFMERLAALVPAAAFTSDPLPRRAGAQREIAQSNRSRSGTACRRDLKRGRPRAGRAAAHELGTLTQTSLRHRHRTLPELRRRFEDHRRPFGRLRAGIEDPPVIDKILSHLHLPTHAAPRAPARRVDLFQTI